MIGAGPANLALLACLMEMRCPILESLSVLERRDSVAWHPGLEFEESSLQVSVFKDLAFLRNPASPFTFFSFLRARGLLYQFIHTNNLYPPRKLFSDYLLWVSQFFRKKISFETEAVAVRYHGKAPGPRRLSIMVRDVSSGALSEEKADNLVIGLGHAPSIPKELDIESPLVIHSNTFLLRMEKEQLRPEMRIAIVGSGQSAGEITRYLLQQQTVSEVIVIGRRHLFGQTDDNPFVNDIYTHPRALKFHSLPSERRKKFLSELRHTNFSTVTRDVLQDIYALAFKDRIYGRDRLKLYSHTEIAEVESLGHKLRLKLRSLDCAQERKSCEVDFLVCATGFSNTRPTALIKSLQPLMEEGKSVVNSSFEALLEREPNALCFSSKPRVFLMNHALDVHGPTEHTLAGLAERAAVVAKELQKEQKMFEVPEKNSKTSFSEELREGKNVSLHGIDGAL